MTSLPVSRIRITIMLTRKLLLDVSMSQPGPCETDSGSKDHEDQIAPNGIRHSQCIESVHCHPVDTTLPTTAP